MYDIISTKISYYKEIATENMNNVISYYTAFSIGGIVAGIILQFISLPFVLKFFEI